METSVTRRGFLGRLAGVVAAAIAGGRVAGPFQPTTLPTVLTPLRSSTLVAHDYQEALNVLQSKALDGISMRFVREYNIQTDQYVQRYDVLYGVATLRPDLACRVHGA